jgi:FkbM family methyltransferase
LQSDPAANSFGVGDFIRPGDRGEFHRGRASLQKHDCGPLESVLRAEHPINQLRAELIEAVSAQVVRHRGQKHTPSHLHHLHEVGNGHREIENVLEGAGFHHRVKPLPKLLWYGLIQIMDDAGAFVRGGIDRFQGANANNFLKKTVGVFPKLISLEHRPGSRMHAAKRFQFSTMQIQLLPANSERMLETYTGPLRSQQPFGVSVEKPHAEIIAATRRRSQKTAACGRRKRRAGGKTARSHILVYSSRIHTNSMNIRQTIKSLLEKIAINFPVYRPLFARQCQTRDLLREMEIGVVIDAGAYIGSYAQELRSWGFKGKILSFEPVPGSYARLCQAMHGDPDWSGLQYGLSDSTRKAVINTYPANDFNSLLPLKDESMAAYEFGGSKSTDVEIQLRRLDEVLPAPLAGNESARVFLKMDTQGHDLSVFSGALGVLDRISGLQSELAVVQLYHGAPAISESLSVYREHGFIPVGFHPVSQTLRGNRVTPEFDVLFNRFSGLFSPTRP